MSIPYFHLTFYTDLNNCWHYCFTRITSSFINHSTQSIYRRGHSTARGCPLGRTDCSLTILSTPPLDVVHPVRTAIGGSILAPVQFNWLYDLHNQHTLIKG